MIEWILPNTNDTKADLLGYVGCSCRYAIYKYENKWIVDYTQYNVAGGYLSYKLKIGYVYAGKPVVVISTGCQFDSIEAAQRICERHCKTMVLQ